MKKLLYVLLVIGLMVSPVAMSFADNSATSYENHIRSYQVFMSAYNNGAAISKNSPVILDIGGGSAGSTLGSQIIGTTTTDSVFAVGIADEDIAATKMGRICIRGPHKVTMVTNIGASSAIPTAAILSTSTTYGAGGIYATADGTVGGQLGILMSKTATTDTGDASNTYWFYVRPAIHK